MSPPIFVFVQQLHLHHAGHLNCLFLYLNYCERAAEECHCDDMTRTIFFYYLCHNYTTWLGLYEELHHPYQLISTNISANYPVFSNDIQELRILHYNHKK
ncbi:hypothetical protein WUBG_13284 [Wuchereria bancrofti]|uniref:Uncharacterized protein n=1 Tax=Wuchereria bancrofti TaxID=6293 RepID=J9EKC5_WUCBA|nr:hypothetical protein WUBG_13284 [Wuchereria bancrofti]